MSTIDPARRGFLRQLASLPLVGGGVTLIGKPTAAAVPVTQGLLNSYDTWLAVERNWLRFERFGSSGEPDGFYDPVSVEAVFRDRRTGECWDFTHYANAGARFDHGRPGPISRAAVVLAAAGVDMSQDLED